MAVLQGTAVNPVGGVQVRRQSFIAAVVGRDAKKQPIQAHQRHQQNSTMNRNITKRVSTAPVMPTRWTSGLWLKGLVLAAGLYCAQYASAISVVAISQGELPTGQIISIIQLTLDPGDTVPWHYHTGPGWGTILSGTLTEDEGCGTELKAYSAGSAFAETPGKVHSVINLGSVPVVMTWTEIIPGCDTSGGTIYLPNGPECEGKSGRSHLEPVPSCND